MLPTPDTSHVPYTRVYEPAEDSFLLLDTLSSPAQIAFLSDRFGGHVPAAAPLVLEVGSGSGVVIAFLTAHAGAIFGASGDVLVSCAVDVSRFACAATVETAAKAVRDVEAGSKPAMLPLAPTSPSPSSSSTSSSPPATGLFLGAVQGDLVAPIRRGTVDVLVFNPPYVPSEDVPQIPERPTTARPTAGSSTGATAEEEFRLLALATDGGTDGMETTDRLLAGLPEVLSPDRGVAYVLLCAQNRPEEVKTRVRAWGDGWQAETVGTKVGWERLQIIRIWRDGSTLTQAAMPS